MSARELFPCIRCRDVMTPGLKCDACRRADAALLAANGRRLDAERAGAAAVAPALVAPIRLVLPFEILCPDNRKYGVLEGRIWTTTRYRSSKKAIGQRAATQYRGEPLRGPLALDARVYFPPQHGGHVGDAPNFGKVVHDALQGVVYVDDKQVHDARWRRAGIDPTDPRVEITITPLEASNV